MAQTATLYRFHLNLSDIDRGVYEDLDLRLAMHPSEIPHYLVTRVLAYALNFERGLEFSPGGLSDADAPCIRGITDNGTLQTWIEIGNPSAKKLHRGAKAARNVKVYTYKDPKNLLQEMLDGKIHRAAEIPIYSLSTKFLDQLSEWLERDNEWSLVHQDGHLTVSSAKGSLSQSLEATHART
jgi:uncharacterized protein YaeQ